MMQHPGAFAARLRRDQKGVAAVEFALVAPVLILFYFGLAEATQATMAERKTIRLASSIGDIVAQRNAWTNTELNDVFAMGEVLMRPYPATTELKICVASLVASPGPNSVKTVAWVKKHNAPADCPNKGDPATVSSDLLGANQSVIMSKVSYTYTGPTSKVIDINPTFTKTFYLRPRLTHSITCATC